MNPSEFDIRMMERALALAAKGTGLVSPNPLVGCVIVSESGEIVGEGTYTYEGVIHAEAKALAEAGTLARGGTAYVSLEPHAHHGKTPPCTEALILAGIRRVVAPIEDPNPLVSGTGFQMLRESGMEVVTGVLAKAGERINEKFRVWHREGRPFIHLKLASRNSVTNMMRSWSAAIPQLSTIRSSPIGAESCAAAHSSASFSTVGCAHIAVFE
jgi:diaminohydroxyphosphoribosylaminopyrimidine deaminase/5-amino-6-(5-phosphoribosylamino)uracil reductase